MPFEQGPGVFVQRLSIWKTFGLELFLIGGAVLPLTPNFSRGLVYTAFLYQMPFFMLLIGACSVLGLMAIVLLLFVWRAVLRLPVLAISDSDITALQLGPRTVAKCDVNGIERIWPGGNINLKIRGQPPLALPIFLYEEPRRTLQQLQPLMDGSVRV